LRFPAKILGRRRPDEQRIARHLAILLLFSSDLGETCNLAKVAPSRRWDEAAEILLSLAAKRAEPIHLDDDTREAVREGKAQSGREDSRRTRRWPRSSPPRRMRARENAVKLPPRIFDLANRLRNWQSVLAQPDQVQFYRFSEQCSVSSTAAPVATHPGRSGTYAE
jgi:hypothetical protein